MTEARAARAAYSPRGALVLAALDVLPDASIMVFDTDLVFVVVRGEALRDVGMDPEALEERRADEALSPSRWAFYEPFYRAALAGESSSLEVGAVSGERRYVVNVGPVRDHAGGIIGGVAVATDVSDHMRLREALEESEERFRLLAENSSDVVVRVDDAWDIGWVSPSVRDVLGYEPDDMIGALLPAYLAPESWQRVEAAYLAWDRSEHLREVLEIVRADGSTLWMEAVARSITPPGSDTDMSVVSLRDVDARVTAQQQAEESHRLYRLLAENASDVVYMADTTGTIRWASPTFATVLGIDPEAAVGMRTEQLIHPDDVEFVNRRRPEVYAGHDADDTIIRYRSADGGYLEMSGRVHLLTDETGTVTGAVLGLRDVTAEQHALRRLARSEERFRLAMTAAPVGMAISDPRGRFVQVNEALCRLLDLDESQLLGSTVASFLAADQIGLVDEVMAALADPGQTTFRHEHALVSPTRTLWVEHSASVLRDETGAPVFYVHQFADHTEANELRQDLEYRASHDPLTGVVNRGELMTQLRHGLRRVHGGASWLGVLFCDIDNLKPLNDEYGHHTGDVAIQTVAQRLRGAVRSQDLVARIGGDEFVVLLEGLHSREQLGAIAEKCRASVEGPVAVDGHSIEVSVSVGAVLAGQDETPDEVLARADHALHRAKVGGRRQVDLD